jgi:hypothetical protein
MRLGPFYQPTLYRRRRRSRTRAKPKSIGAPKPGKPWGT